MAPRMRMHINVQQNGHFHNSSTENAAVEFSMSHCFMNSMYKVLAVSTALLVVSLVCAVVKVMTGLKKIICEIATTPLSWLATMLLLDY